MPTAKLLIPRAFTIRNQQVAGSIPAGGSRDLKRYQWFRKNKGGLRAAFFHQFPAHSERPAQGGALRGEATFTTEDRSVPPRPPRRGAITAHTTGNPYRKLYAGRREAGAQGL